MRKYCFIPARMGSSRFPGKPLFKINNKPMIEWIYLSSKESNCDEVYITTPDQEIIDFCNEKNFPVLRTSSKHERCLDRIYESYNLLRNKSASDIIVCMQGDEPLIEANMINNIINFHTQKKIGFCSFRFKNFF